MPSEFDDYPVVLLYPDPSGDFSCRGFVGGHLAEPVFIVVEGAETTDMAAAADVGWDLARQIGLLPGMVGGKHSVLPPRFSFPGLFVTHSGRRNIYVRVSNGGVGPFRHNLWDHHVAQPPAHEKWTVMLTVPARRQWGGDPWAVVQAGFPELCNWAKCNAFRSDRTAREVVPAVIAIAGLAPSENRVFISYIRRETSAIADQLFVELTKRGFDVFLDRCGVPPAVLFQERLMQDLDDKAVVVLLHSAGIVAKRSSWVEEELLRVKQYRHGLIAVCLPNKGGTPVRLCAGIDPQAVHAVRSADMSGKKLKKAALAEVVMKVGEAHARSLVRRRKELTESLGAELHAAGKSSRVLPGGDVACGASAVVVRVSARPPAVGDYRGLQSRHGGTAGAVLTPAPLVLLDRQDEVRWLEAVSGIKHVDQENARNFVRLNVT